MNVGYVHTLETPDNAVDRGTLRVSVIDRDTNQPVQNARAVSYTHLDVYKRQMCDYII